jgi:hypothetical protein
MFRGSCRPYTQSGTCERRKTPGEGRDRRNGESDGEESEAGILPRALQRSIDRSIHGKSVAGIGRRNRSKETQKRKRRRRQKKTQKEREN